MRDIIELLSDINGHRYINLWKEINLVRNYFTLKNLSKFNQLSPSVLYIVDSSSYDIHIISNNYNVVDLSSNELVDIIYKEKSVDHNVIYILKLNSSDIEKLSLRLKDDSISYKVQEKSFYELSRFKSTTDESRYKSCDRIMYEDGEVLVESMDRVIVPKNLDDIYYEVPVKFENRLDLISYFHYGTTKYWWIIAYASNIYNPMIIPVGTILRVPSQLSIFKLLRRV